MSDEQEVKPDEVQAEAPAVEPEAPAAKPPAAAAAVDNAETEEGKVFAILSYALSFIGIPFFLVPLIMRNNEFSLYHAKQSLQIWLASVVLGTVCGMLMVVCIGAILLPVVMIGLLVFNIMGLVNAINGEIKPVPIIGKWGEEWFKGIKKV